MKFWVKFLVLIIVFFSFDSYSQNNKDYLNASLKINGEQHNLSEFQGKFILLQFWATWCPYCERQMPELVKIQQRYKDNPNLVILPVSIDEGGEEIVKNFYKSRNYNIFPVVLDENKNLYRIFNLRGVPTSVLISDSGEIIDVFNSVSQIDLALFDKILKN
ncbi:MAG: TlpA disulfide reductase family protein [Rickettsiales bacterium]|nr:TlpA disulfide reductase family protein [Rickettsiales bacterium]